MVSPEFQLFKVMQPHNIAINSKMVQPTTLDIEAFMLGKTISRSRKLTHNAIYENFPQSMKALRRTCEPNRWFCSNNCFFFLLLWALLCWLRAKFLCFYLASAVKVPTTMTLKWNTHFSKNSTNNACLLYFAPVG